MAKSFMDMVTEAKSGVTGITAAEAYKKLQENPDVLLIEVRDAESVPNSDRAPDVAMISLGSLPIRADLQVPEGARDPRLADRSKQVITT